MTEGDKPKLPITCYCCCKDGEPYLRKALKSVEFCDQRIFVNDGSSDNSVRIARELGWEIFEWTGPNSMCERRNYAVGFKGTDDYVPHWVTDPDLSKNHPKIKHEFILQIDHDEVFEEATYGALKEFSESKKIEYNAYGFHLINVYTGPEGPNQEMTHSPLMRLFRRNKVHWREEIQNNVVFEGMVGWIGTRLYHYGYGSWEQHWAKQWGRLKMNEDRVRNNPDDIHSRGYLINCLTVVGERDVLNFERIIAHVTIAINDFMKTRNDESEQVLIERILRHFWAVCANNGRFLEFLYILDKVQDYIKWIVDVPYWRVICEYNNKPDIDLEYLDEITEEFLKRMDEYCAPPVKNIEVQSMGFEPDACKNLYEYFMNYLLGSEGFSDRPQLAKKAEYWAKKVILYTFYKEFEAHGLNKYLIDNTFKYQERLDYATDFVYGDNKERDEIYKRVRNKIKIKEEEIKKTAFRASLRDRERGSDYPRIPGAKR